MATPIENNAKLTGYTGLQAGAVKNPSNETYLNAGATVGGEVKYKGAFLRAQVEGGTAIGGKAEAGYSFDIGKNMGLELSAKAQASRSLIQKEGETFTSAQTVRFVQDDNTTEAVNMFYSESSWKPGEIRTGGSAKITFGSEKAKFGVGIEGGMRKSTRPTINSSAEWSINTNDINNASNKVVVSSSYSSTGYVTPTLSADVKLSKHLSFNANADLYQGQAGIRYNF